MYIQKHTHTYTRGC